MNNNTSCCSQCVGVRLLQLRVESGDTILELENNRRADALSEKVNLLKTYAKEIRDETKEQNQFLGTLQHAADSAETMIWKTVGRVVGVSRNKRENRKLLILTVCVFLVVFLLYTICRYLPS